MDNEEGLDLADLDSEQPDLPDDTVEPPPLEDEKPPTNANELEAVYDIPVQVRLLAGERSTRS